MSTLPIPLLSLLRRFFFDISVKKVPNPEPRPIKTFGVFGSLLRAAAIPSLAYLWQWNTRLKTSLSTSDASGTLNEELLGTTVIKEALSKEKTTPNNGGKGNGERGPVKKNGSQKGDLYDPNSPIYQLMNNPALVDPIRKPRNPVVLAHGLYGFDVRGFSAWPKVQIHYWSDVLQVLRRKVGAEVIVTRAPSTGSIQERAANMHDILKSEACGREINFIAHSMGGLDCRHLISNIKPKEYQPLSLITVCTPHRGSPFMDWLQERIGIGTVRHPIPGITPKAPAVPLPASVVSFLDSPAYSNLTSTYLNAHFNPSTPNSPDVKYWSIAARTPGMSFFHPLWLPKLITDEFEEKRKSALGTSGHGRNFGNDGLVPLESAKWGEFLGVLEECDHWDIRGAGGLSAHTPEEFEEKSGDKESWGSKWSWSDWQRFLGIWNDDKSRRDKVAALNQNPTKFAKGDSSDEKAKVVAALEDPKVKQELVKDAKSGDSQGVSTMDYLLDWVVDNVPGVSSVKDPLKLVVEKAGVGGTASDKEKSSEAARSSSESRKAPRFDLERFYIALSRKLYDEGF